MWEAYFISFFRSTTNVEDIDLSEKIDNHVSDSEDDNHSEPHSGIEKDISSQSLHSASDHGNESLTVVTSASASNMLQGNEKAVAPKRKKNQKMPNLCHF